MRFDLDCRRACRHWSLLLVSAAFVISADVLAASHTPEVVIDYPWHAPLAKKAAPAGVRVIAIPHEVDLDSRRDGVWSTTGNVRRWELTVRVPGARSVAAELTFQPVAGAALEVAGETLISARQRFVSMHSGKETVTLLMTAPASGGDPHVAITGLMVSEPKTAAKATEPGAWINYNCHRTPDNTPNGRATVMASIESGGGCTATLIDNKAGPDGQPVPMLLLARHCGDMDQGEEVVLNLILYWRAELACGEPWDNDPYYPLFEDPDTVIRQRAYGRMTAGWPYGEGDLWLIELDNWPPAAADAWLAGIDARSRIPDPGPLYVLHHSFGEPKQYLSTETWGFLLQTENDKAGYFSLDVTSEEAIGGTRPGASGSGLFSGVSHRLLGVVSSGGDTGTNGHPICEVWTGDYNGGMGRYLVPNPQEASSRVLPGQPAPLPAEPAVTLTVDRDSVIVYEDVTLTWSSENATHCVASDAWIEEKARSGSETVRVERTGANNRYVLTCEGAGGSVSTSVVVRAASPPPPTPTPGPGGDGAGSGAGGGGAFAAWAVLLALLRRHSMPRSSESLPSPRSC